MPCGAIAVLALLLIGGGPGPERAPAPAGPLPDERLGIRTAPLLLLSRPDIRADLRLEPAQVAAAELAITELYVQAAALRGKSGPEALEARRAIDAAQARWIGAHLSEAQQRRLDQVDLQWEGPSALVNRPVVADHLGLSAEQRSVLTRAVAECRAGRAQGPSATAERRLAERTLAVLSKEQKERWRAMLGRPFHPRLEAVAEGKSMAPADAGLRRAGHDRR